MEKWSALPFYIYFLSVKIGFNDFGVSVVVKFFFFSFHFSLILTTQNHVSFTLISPHHLNYSFVNCLAEQCLLLIFFFFLFLHAKLIATEKKMCWKTEVPIVFNNRKKKKRRKKPQKCCWLKTLFNSYSRPTKAKCSCNSINSDKIHWKLFPIGNWW